MMVRDKEAKKAYDRKYHQQRKEKRNAERNQNPDKYKNQEIQAKYGISINDYYLILGMQGGVCSICGSIDPKFGRKYFCVDHCHSTGKVRGLLCHTCNLGLGHFDDSLQLIQSAQAYLTSPPADILP
jgi:hypothetical protein